MKRLPFSKACTQYVDRYTMEHVPAWAGTPLDRSQLVVEKPTDEGDYYAPQFRTDREWYEHTLFPGEPDYPFKDKRETNCYTTGATWPLGKWLTAPYRK